MSAAPLVRDRRVAGRARRRAVRFPRAPVRATGPERGCRRVTAFLTVYLQNETFTLDNIDSTGNVSHDCG